MPLHTNKGLKTAAFALWLFCGVASANPENPTVVAGSASFSQIDPSTLQVTASDKAIINWEKFSIDFGQTTRFVQSNSSAAVLNRVTSGAISKLSGLLEGNSKIYLINPNGVIIGSTGVVNTASFIGSSFDILDADFLSGGNIRFAGEGKASVVNLGKITGFDGDIFLIGRHVSNPGEISASGTAGLAAGCDILLMPSGKERIGVMARIEKKKEDSTGIDMSGALKAANLELKADGYLYSMAVKHSGKIDATNVVSSGGRVFLEAPGGHVGVTGTIEAPGSDVYVLGDKVALYENGIVDTSADHGGGKVFLGGSFQGKDPDILNASGTFVGPDARIKTDALAQGNAGQVVVWADGDTLFYGGVSAKGGPAGGDGGLVEVSGKRFMDFGRSALCERSAPLGSPGILLLDPTNLEISNGFGTNIQTTNLAGGTFPVIFSPLTFGVTSLLDVGTLTGATGLGGGSVVIMTGNDGGTSVTIGIGDGDINWLDGAPVGPLATANSLTLISSNNINMYTTYDNSGGSGGLIMKAAGDITFTSQPGTGPTSQPQAIVGTGSLILDAGRNINLLATDVTVNLVSGGSSATPISLTAQNGSINLIASPTSASSVQITSGGAAITMKAVEGNIVLQGGDAMGSTVLLFNTNGAHDSGATSLTTTNGDIILNGGLGSGSTVSVSHSSTAAFDFAAYGGNIRLTGGEGSSSNVSLSISSASPATFSTTDGSIILTAGPSANSGSGVSITGMGFNDLNFIADGGDIRLIGGMQASNTATITQMGAGATRLSSYRGDISLLGGFGSNAFVQIQHNSFSPISLASYDGSILLSPGNNTGSYAQVSTNIFGDASFTATNGNIILQGAAGSFDGITNRPQISSGMMGGSLYLTTNNGDIRLLGGSSMNATATILQQSSNLTTLQANSGDIILLGGSNMSANAEIQHSSFQPLQLITKGGDISLTGGNGSACHAQLVAGTSADVILSATSGNILFTGGLGAGMGSNAQIVQNGGAIQLTTQGGDIQLLGGNSNTNFAQIQQFTSNPTTLIAKEGGVYLTGGTGDISLALIQHSSSQPLELSALGGDIVFTGGNGNGSSAQIQIFGMLAPSIALATTDGSIFFKGGTGTGSGSSAGIFSMGSTVGDISLLANGGSIKLLGGGNNNTAFVLQNGPGSTTFSAKQGDVAFLGGAGGSANAFITHNSLRPLEISTVQGSIFLTGGEGNTSLSQITSTGGDIRFSSDGCGIYLTGGLGTMGAMSTASITNTATGAIFLSTNAGPIEIKGGNAASNTAFIQHTGNGPTTLKTTDGNILLQGGNQGGASVFINNSSLGSITLNTDNGNISLIGGIPNISVQSSARIQQTGGGMNMFPGPITLNANEGSIFLVGGMSSQSDASITSTNGAVIVYAQGGDLRLLSNEGLGGGSSFTQISAGTTVDILAGIDCILRAGNGGGLGQMYADISAGTLLSLSVGRNCILSGGLGMGASGAFTGTQASLRGAAGMSASIGGNWTITGGSGANAFAGAFTPVGNMNFFIGGNLTLTAGSNGGTFAQIGHFLPTGVVNIDFQNVGGSVVLQGSQTSNINNSPAVIGLGDLFNPVFSLSGDIVFSGAIGANLILNGGFGAMGAGSDTFNFAQIGHFGRSAGGSITGDIRIANIGNNVALFPSETYAAIGHGTTTLNWPEITGNVLIDNIGGDLSLMPGALVTMGANIQPTAQIGHVAAAALSGDIFVDNVSGNITATGSDFAGGSAIIGHGNGRLLAGASSQGQISIHASNIALSGGDETGAEAVIGFAGATTVISPAPLNVTAEHDITLAAGTPTAVGVFGGNAVIGFANPNPATITNAVLSTISVISNLGGINLIGGVGDSMNAFTAGLAFIGMNNSNFNVMTPPISFANVVVSAPNGIISLQAVPFNSNFDYGNAAILNNQRGRVDPVDLIITAKELSLLGGKPLPVMAPDGFGTVHIYSSRNAAFAIANDLTLNAGLGSVEISNGTGNGGAPGVGTMSFDIGGNLTVLGGSGLTLTSSAQIGFPEPFTGLGQTPIVFTRVGGDVIVQGGRSTNAFALIGHGRGGNAGTISGDIIFDTVGGDVIVSGGQLMAAGTFGHIGHVGTSAGGSIISGDILLNNVRGSVRLNGGVQQNTSAVIGHGDSGSNGSDSYSGQVVVHANGVQINAGGLGGAAIGFESNFPAGPATISSNLVEVVSTAPITLVGGSGGNAVIGFFGNMGGGTTQIRNVNVFAEEGAISLTAGTAGGGFGGRAAIGTRALNGVCESEIAVKTNRELVLTGSAVPGGAQALIANNNANIAAPFNVSIDPSTLILNGGADGSGTAFIYASDTLDIEVKDALYINANGQALGGAGAGGATIQAQNTININTVTPSSAVIMMFGTSSMTFTTEIRSFGGDINIGSPSVLGADTIIIGRPSMAGGASLITQAGDIFIKTSGDISVLGGSAGTAQISANNAMGQPVKSVDIRTAGDLLVSGFAGPGLITATGDVNINTGEDPSGTITILGGTVGAAGIVQSANGNINIGTPMLIGASTLTVGSNAMTGAAQLLSSTGDIFAKLSGDITILGGNMVTAEMNAGKTLSVQTAGDISVAGFTGIARMLAAGDININTLADPSGSISLVGGSGAGTGLIQSSAGNINVGTPMLIGAGTLTVGSNAMMAPASLAAFGDIFAKLSGDVSILGGAGATAEINAGRTLSVWTAGDVTVSGFSGLARMVAAGDIDLNTGVDPSGTLTILGPGLVQTSGGNINIGTPDLVGFDTLTIGSAAMMAPANLTSQTGDVFANISGDISIFGGASMIGIGAINAASDMVLIAGGNISLTGAVGSAEALTTDGLINFTAGNSISLGFNSNIANAMGTNSILLAALANLNLLTATSAIANTGGGDVRATLGQDLAMTNGSITANGLGGVSISAGRNISVSGGTIQGGGLMDFAAGETITVAGTIANTGLAGSNTLFNALVNLNILGGTISSSGGGDIQATLGNDLAMTGGSITLAGAGNIKALAERHITSIGGSITNTGTGEIYLVADYNMTLTNATVTTASGTLVLVVDNEFPDPPKYGTGTMTITGGSVMSGGDKRYYIPRQRYNQVAGFAKGTEYTDTASEIWNSYFNRSLEGNPLTVFYKDSGVQISPTPPGPHFSPSKFNLFLIAIAEAQQDWRTYDDFIFFDLEFGLNYNCPSYTQLLSAGSMTSCQVVQSGSHRFLRPSRRNYHTKKLELSL